MYAVRDYNMFIDTHCVIFALRMQFFVRRERRLWERVYRND